MCRSYLPALILPFLMPRTTKKGLSSPGPCPLLFHQIQAGPCNPFSQPVEARRNTSLRSISKRWYLIYKSKRSGHGRYQHQSPTQYLQFDLLQVLRHAQLLLHYTPQYILPSHLRPLHPEAVPRVIVVRLALSRPTQVQKSSHRLTA